ncbi:MAG TPA: nicotinate-nucleotide adenylyltransferase [Vicinamibacteria bacterium]
MRIGLMGGTFDPIHLGHLRAAETAREALGLDRVAFVPAGVPPHRGAPISPALDRYAMVCLATAGHAHFVPSDFEIRREGPSFTVDTVAALLAETPAAAITVIVGSDTFPEMPTWRDPERLFSLAEVAVVDRPGGTAEGPLPSLPPGARGVHRVSGPGLAVSATSVRERVRRGESVSYLVPETVADYITKRRLYAPMPSAGRDR